MVLHRNHCCLDPIFLELGKGDKKPRAPFKYNPSWFEEEEFQNLVHENWKSFEFDLDVPTCV
jgi:hypothetical protein